MFTANLMKIRKNIWDEVENSISVPGAQKHSALQGKN
jgi:hypothetical protein